MSFAIIVPTLNEARAIARTLADARRVFGPAAELIVADGGSTDDTAAIARDAGATVLVSRPSRGAQLNAGARVATADVLLFLHADTKVADDAPARIEDALAGTDALGGCCRFRLDPPATSPGFRLLERAVNARTRWLKTATGDQAMFVRREAWARLGGFPEQPLFEDVAFARRLRRAGGFRVARTDARTSSRRWLRRGFVRTVVTHWAFRLAYAAGVPPTTLARRYYRRAHRPG